MDFEIREKPNAATVAESWKEQYDYCWESDRALADERTPKQIYEQLTTLANPTAETVAAIIGNDSWTTQNCGHCGEERDRLVVFDSACGDSETALCASCLRAAADALSGHIGTLVPPGHCTEAR